MKRLDLRFVRLRDLTPGHRVGALLGLVMVVGGVLGLVFGWGSSTTTTRGVTRPRVETPQAFLVAFTKALRDGDRGFLFDRLDPAVIARYGASQCRSFTAQLADPSAELRLASVRGPTPYAYTSDGRSVTVADTYTFHVTGTRRHQPATRDFHFALVRGRFRIFVDCGQPTPGSS